MTKEVTLYIIFILLTALSLFWLVIIITISKQKENFRQAKKCMIDQKNIIVIRLIKELDDPMYYYKKKYTHQIIGNDVDSNEEISLYVTNTDIVDFIEREEYQVIHDGVVLFEYHRNYF